MLNADIIRTPAKVNLYLHVLGKNKDNYHILDSLVMFCTDLYDEIIVEEAEENKIIVQGEFAKNVSGTNILEKVLELFKPLLPKKNFKIAINKNIPVGAGIGGGSSNAAGVIKFLINRYNLDLSLSEKIKLSSQIGADVPMFHYEKSLYFSGIGDVITSVEAPIIFAVLVYPNVSISTLEVFSAGIKNYRIEHDRKYSFEGPEGFCGYIKDQRNDLYENSVSIVPELTEIIAQIKNIKECLVARMSGSGSTCFGLFKNNIDAQSSAKALQLKFPDYYICVTKLV